MARLPMNRSRSFSCAGRSPLIKRRLKSSASKAPLHVADVLADPEYTSTRRKRSVATGLRWVPAVARRQRGRRHLCRKTRPEPYSANQIELVTTFADQAVIAIEASTCSTICRRAPDLADRWSSRRRRGRCWARSAARSRNWRRCCQERYSKTRMIFCGAKFATINLYDGERYAFVAGYNVPHQYSETQLNKPLTPRPEGIWNGRGDTPPGAYRGRQETARSPISKAMPPSSRFRTSRVRRTLAIVPMLKDDRLVGTLAYLSARRSARSATSRSALARQFCPAGGHRHREQPAA